jgi:hypothetical protein
MLNWLAVAGDRQQPNGPNQQLCVFACVCVREKEREYTKLLGLTHIQASNLGINPNTL